MIYKLKVVFNPWTTVEQLCMHDCCWYARVTQLLSRQLENLLALCLLLWCSIGASEKLGGLRGRSQPAAEGMATNLGRGTVHLWHHRAHFQACVFWCTPPWKAKETTGAKVGRRHWLLSENTGNVSFSQSGTFAVTGRPLKVEQWPNQNRRGKKECTESGEKCRRGTVFVVKCLEIGNDVPVDFLSLDCSLRHIETTPGQLFSVSLLFFPCLLFAPLTLHWHFCLTWKWSAVFWATYLTPPSLPATVCSQFVSALTASCRPRAQQWPVWMFRALCCCCIFRLFSFLLWV